MEDNRLKKVTISNFRSIVNITLNLNPGINLFVGPNGSGKSNILKAVSSVFAKELDESDKSKFSSEKIQIAATGINNKSVVLPPGYFDPEHCFYMMPLRTYQISSGVVKSLKSDGENIAGAFNYYRSSMAESEDLELFRKRIKRIVPEVESVKAPYTSNGTAKLMIQINKDNKSIEVDVNGTPTGTLDAIFIVFVLQLFPEGSVYILDSPDSHLHASSQEGMMKLIREISEKESKQFIIATHSPYIVDMCSNEEVFLVTKDGFETKTAPVSDKKEIIELLESTETRLSDVASSMEPVI